MGRTRIPALGPRGEGWTALQVLLLVAIPMTAWRASAMPPHDPPSAVVQAIGGILLIGGLALIGASLLALRRARALSALPRPLDSGSLVVSGAYRWVRHPIYAGLVLAGIGVWLIRMEPLLAVLAAALFLVLDLKRRREETWLLERYPDYAAYRASTRALVPFLY